MPTNSVVSAVSREPGRIDVFVVGHNGGIYTSGQTGAGDWETWHPIGDPATGHTVPTHTVVSAVTPNPEEVDIFAVGHNGGIYTNRWGH